MKLLKKDLLYIVINCIGLICIIFFVSKKTESGQRIERDLNESYVFTNPIIDCQNFNNNTSGVISHTKLENVIQTLEKKYSINRSSVYYRDLKNGQWVGVNEKEIFSPASMMKTPLLIAFLKNAERDPLLLQKKVIATNNYFEDEIRLGGSVTTKIEKDGSYTLEDLLYRMVEDSDNIATRILLDHIKQEDVDNLLKSVGSEVQEEVGGDVLIRVKDFAAFFRILYNSSYLNRDMSEKALSILEQTSFKDGIVKGVPSFVQVAHKYGERQFKSIYGVELKKQFHDCGIVYASENHYIICVMTQGDNIEEQKEFISKVSSYIYDQISKKE